MTALASAPIRPIIRKEVEHLFLSEDLSRRARRALTQAGPQPSEEIISAAERDIVAAIASLVAARAKLREVAP